MIAIVIDYPEELIIRSTTEFKDLDDRTEWLQKYFKRKGIGGDLHDYDDYVVEAIDIITETDNEKLDAIEIWVVGS